MLHAATPFLLYVPPSSATNIQDSNLKRCSDARRGTTYNTEVNTCIHIPLAHFIPTLRRARNGEAHIPPFPLPYIASLRLGYVASYCTISIAS